jgi:FtsZ-binding cell division protein ZapB
MALTHSASHTVDCDIRVSTKFDPLFSVFDGALRGLRSIHLSVDIADSEVPDSFSGAERGVYRLDELNFGRSTIDVPGRLAFWLCDICPADHIMWEDIEEDSRRDGIFEGLESTVRELQKRSTVVDDELKEQNASLQEEVDSLRATIAELQKSETKGASEGRAVGH